MVTFGIQVDDGVLVSWDCKPASSCLWVWRQGHFHFFLMFGNSCRTKRPESTFVYSFILRLLDTRINALNRFQVISLFAIALHAYLMHTYASIQDYVQTHRWEGVVFIHASFSRVTVSGYETDNRNISPCLCCVFVHMYSFAGFLIKLTPFKPTFSDTAITVTTTTLTPLIPMQGILCAHFLTFIRLKIIILCQLSPQLCKTRSASTGTLLSETRCGHEALNRSPECTAPS